MEHVTTEHEEIRKWAEKHRGWPEKIDDPTAGADRTGIRIGFPGRRSSLEVSPDDLHKISWEEFFSEFERLGLAFVYEDRIPRDVRPIDAYRFLRREILQAVEQRETFERPEEL